MQFPVPETPIGRMARYVRLPSEALAIAWIGEETIVASCRDGKMRVINTFILRIERERAAVAKLGYSLAPHPADGSVAVGGLNGERPANQFEVPALEADSTGAASDDATSALPLSIKRLWVMIIVARPKPTITVTTKPKPKIQ
jgi:hypothetical protein